VKGKTQILREIWQSGGNFGQPLWSGLVNFQIFSVHANFRDLVDAFLNQPNDQPTSPEKKIN